MSGAGPFGWIADLVKRDRSEEAAQPLVTPPEPDGVREDESAPLPEAKAAVSERSARALLASGTPSLPPEPTKPTLRRRRERRPEPALPEPEAPPAVSDPTPREWNIWELQRAARGADDQERQEEWSALFIHLREFATADGNLPVEFDGLVRESFAGVLEREPAAS